MITAAFYPQTWFSDNVDPKLINTDCSWSTFNNPWPVDDSTSRPSAIDEINQHFLPYGQDAFVSGPPPSPILSSLEITDTSTIVAACEPTSALLSLQDIFQDALPVTQHSLFPLECGTTWYCPPREQALQENLPHAQQSAYPFKESFTGEKTAAAPSDVPSSRKTPTGHLNTKSGSALKDRQNVRQLASPSIESHIESGRVPSYGHPTSASSTQNSPVPQRTHTPNIPMISPYTSHHLSPKFLEINQYQQRRQQSIAFGISFELGRAPDRVPSLSFSGPPSASSSRTPSPSAPSSIRASACSRRPKLDDRSVQEINSDPDCIYKIVLDANGKRKYQCKTCPEICTYHKGDMSRHIQSMKHTKPSHLCRFCSGVFTRPDALKRHIVDAHTAQKRKHELKRKSEPEVEESTGVRLGKRAKTCRRQPA